MAGMSKLYAISDNPFVCTGLALAGISSQPAQSPDELSRALEGIAPDIGIVIVTAGLAAICADILEKYRGKAHVPLIVVIPEP